MQPVPEGYHTLTPYLAVDDAAAAIDYYKKAFGAKERMRMEAPDGKIGHAELEIGDSLSCSPIRSRTRRRRPPKRDRRRERRASSCTSRTSTPS